jgi:hypothetical protein
MQLRIFLAERRRGCLNDVPFVGDLPHAVLRGDLWESKT